MFQYGSTTENLANKLIKKLNFFVNLKINGDLYSSVKYSIHIDNFSSRLFINFKEISKYKFEQCSSFNFEFWLQSKEFNLHLKSHEFQLNVENLLKKSTKSKAFNYYYDNNLLLVFFE